MLIAVLFGANPTEKDAKISGPEMILWLLMTNSDHFQSQIRFFEYEYWNHKFNVCDKKEK